MEIPQISPEEDTTIKNTFKNIEIDIKKKKINEIENQFINKEVIIEENSFLTISPNIKKSTDIKKVIPSNIYDKYVE